MHLTCPARFPWAVMWQMVVHGVVNTCEDSQLLPMRNEAQRDRMLTSLSDGYKKAGLVPAGEGRYVLSEFQGAPRFHYDDVS